MIRSFKDKRAERLFQGERVPRFQPIADRLRKGCASSMRRTVCWRFASTEQSF
jgi:hypothetical protein